jgi:glycosyltransferase involved in cell wall biosynthesis
MWNATPLGKVIQELGLRENVTSLGYVEDEDLPLLYGGARVFLYPSLHEGFGLPPLEAMACGTPVIAGRSGSLPEVLGDGALWVDPYDVDAIADGMTRLLTDEALRAELVARGFARARLFSWRTTAATTLGVYEEAASAP